MFSRRCVSVMMWSVLIAGATSWASADVVYNVSFNDPGNLFAGYYDALTSTLIEAGNDWSKYLPSVPGTTTINAEIRADTTIPRENGASTSANQVYVLPDGTRVYEQGLGELYRTGVAPSGASPDLIININPSYLINELSFATVTPSDRTDALSVFTHELGHAIGINGFRNLTTGAIPSDASGPYESTYDRWMVFASDGTPEFTGSTAEQIYGDLFNNGVAAPVPLTVLGGSQALYHLGNGDINSTPCPSPGLLSDLMNGVVFCRGERYQISPLDLAILEDTGLKVDFSGQANNPVPEPSTIRSLVCGLLALSLYFGGKIVTKRNGAGRVGNIKVSVKRSFTKA